MSIHDKPAAIVQNHADLRILAQECKSIYERISNQHRNIVAEYRELGIRLVRVKAFLDHGEYGPWLKQYGISTQRASEAMRIAECWDQIPGTGSLNEVLNALTLASEDTDALEEHAGDVDEDAEPAKPTPQTPPASPAEQAVAAADEAEPEEEKTPDELLAEVNTQLESWCRSLMKYGETMPDDPWLRDLNRRDGAMQKLKGVCETIRSAKCVCLCPKCEGTGCRICHKTGRLTRYAKEQLG